MRKSKSNPAIRGEHSDALAADERIVEDERSGRAPRVLDWPHDATRLTRVALGVGFGATTAVVWDVLEYLTFIPGSPEAVTACQDTLGDFTLGLLGSLIGASIAVWCLDRGDRDR